MPNQRPGIPADANGLLDLFDLSLLWRRKWSLVLSALVAAGIAAAYLQQEDPVYEVTARVLVQQERFATDQERLVRTDPSFLATQSEILRSPVVVQPALKSLDQLAVAEPDFEATTAVMRALRVSTVTDANVLKLTYRSNDSDYAVRLLKEIVDTYRQYSKEMQHGGFTDTLKVLAQRDAELRAELEHLEEQYYLLRRDSPLIGQGKEAFSAHLGMLEELGRRVTEARSLRIDKETEMQTMLLARGMQVPEKLGVRLDIPAELLVDSGEPATSQSATFVAIRTDDTQELVENEFVEGANYLKTIADPGKIQQELWESELLKTTASQVYGEFHPEYRAATDQIAFWQARLKEYEEAAPELLSQQLAALQKNEARLTEIYNAELQEVKLLDSSMLKEQNALAEIQRVQDIHAVTAKQLRDLEFADEALANGQITTIVRMLESPDGTSKLVWPRPAQFISLCAALGFVAGCVLVTLAERVTRRC